MGEAEEFQKDTQFQRIPENVHALTAQMHYRRSYEELASSNTLSDLVDIVQLQKLAEAHYKAAGMPIGIIDAVNGVILVGVGWQEICVQFHRVHADSARRCEESDHYIKNHILEGKPCAYKCQNGLWDIGIPILVEDQHLATLFLGQFLYEGESPDRNFFIRQGRQFGYDLSAYLAALDQIPIFSRETVDNILDYNVAFASFIADMAGKKKRLKRELAKRKQTEEALKQSEQKFRAIFDQTFQFMGLLSVDGRLIEANSNALQFVRVQEADVLGKPFWETPWWRHSTELQDTLRAAIKKAAAGEFVRFELFHFAADRSPRAMDFSLKPVMDKAGGIAFLIAEARDINERKRAEEELRKSRNELELRVRERTAALEKANEELRQIPSKLIAVQEEERKRLASELHDSIGQTLAAVKFWVEMALKLRDEGDGTAALNHLEQFVPILQRSIEETRSIYMGLRPSMLDNVGLLATLEWLRQECMRLYPQRHIELEAVIAEEEIPQSLKINIFRIAQEALNNIAKHSKAEWVDISLLKNGGQIQLVVSDDGAGMDLDLIIETSTARSLGLTSMRERSELTGGSFSIVSAPGKGTTIQACWPKGDVENSWP